MASARRLYDVYMHYLNVYPWRTTVIGTGVLCGLGDIIAQQAVERRGLTDHSVKRTAIMSGLGVFMIGPGLRSLYLILDRLVRGTGTNAVVKKVILDQSLWAPSITAAVFTSVGLLNGQPMTEVKDTLSKNYFSAMKANYCLWPWVQLVNFYFVPFHHRVLVVNVVALFWNTYLAWITNKNVPN